MKKFVSAITVIVALVCIYTISSSADTKYAVQPQVYVEPYKTDAARMFESYERIMTQYQLLLEKNLTASQTDTAVVIQKLDQISSEIDQLSVRLSRIEKALNIKEEDQQKVKDDRQTPAK